ncbi:MAG: flagellar motor switch protein FliN [Candidatus Margulisiibacteriota bacterium]|jgi:flagellar motor switch protein FliN/FliY
MVKKIMPKAKAKTKSKIVKKEFDDPLKNIDPIMEDIFSTGDEEDKLDNEDLSVIEDNTVPSISKIQFPMLEVSEENKKIEEDIFSSIPVSVTVELGRSELSLKDVYELRDGSIIELSRFVGEPLDLVINGQIIAHGEVVSVDNNYGLRITEIIAKA